MLPPPHSLVINARQAFKAGDLPGATSLVEMRLNDTPDDTQALELKALIAQRRGDLPAAEAIIRQALAFDPACEWAHNDLTLLLRDSGQRDAAEMAAREALAALPDDAQSHLQLGVILAEKDDLPAAEFHNRRALALAGPHPQILLNLGLTLYNQGRLDEAEQALLEAHRLAPDTAMVMGHLARMFEAKRDIGSALAWLERAEAAGRRTGEDFTLLRAHLLGNSDSPQEALDLIETNKELGGPAMLDRARLLDRLHRYDEAWPALIAAKAQLSADMNLTYQADRVTRQYSALTSFFTADRMQRLPTARVRSDVAQPIFILGFPRSGTTLLEQVLASHPQVQAGGELPFVHEWQALVRHLLPGDSPFPDKLALTQAADYRHIPGLLRDYYLGRAETYAIGAAGRPLFTDKMPLNDALLPLIQLAFPGAPIIRLVRHPFDVAVSVLMHNLTHGENCGYALDTVISHIKATHALNVHYDAVLQKPVMVLKYEDFVADQEGQTRRVLGQCGLDFDPACLRFYDNPRHAPTPSYAQVTKPLNDRSIGRWQPYAEHFTPYLDDLAPVFEALGYTA